MAALVPLGSDTTPPLNTAELKRLFVHSDARGRGVAGRLLDRIEAGGARGGGRGLAFGNRPPPHPAGGPLPGPRGGRLPRHPLTRIGNRPAATRGGGTVPRPRLRAD
nr:GNAT family N-acetyltransferase [Cryobacterium sp.]